MHMARHANRTSYGKERNPKPSAYVQSSLYLVGDQGAFKISVQGKLASQLTMPMAKI